jgi:hypothetical protein
MTSNDKQQSAMSEAHVVFYSVLHSNRFATDGAIRLLGQPQ